MDGVLHLRLIVPADLIDVVVEQLAATPGVVHLVRGTGSATRPDGEVVSCDVVRESANEVIERLQDHGVHRRGAIVVEALDMVVSDAAAAAEASSPGEGGDALVWEQLEARTRDEATLTVSFLVFMSIAATIAAIGILLDSPILVIGAMVVGPDYGPLAALCVALVRRRRHHALVAVRTLVAGVSLLHSPRSAQRCCFVSPRLLPTATTSGIDSSRRSSPAQTRWAPWSRYSPELSACSRSRKDAAVRTSVSSSR